VTGNDRGKVDVITVPFELMVKLPLGGRSRLGLAGLMKNCVTNDIQRGLSQCARVIESFNRCRHFSE